MSHEIETAFFVQTPPWHNLGTLLTDAPQTAIEAITAAGLNWFVTKESLAAVVPLDGSYRAVGVHDQYAIIRRRIEHGITRLDALGVVGKQYLDHDRNQSNADARVHSAWLGQGMQLKQQALNTALQLAA